MEVVVFKQVKTPMDIKYHNSQQANNRDLIVSNKQGARWTRFKLCTGRGLSATQDGKPDWAVEGEQLSTTMYLTDDGIGIDR
jgi:hypothetical protein